jgi:hypothetical protein
MPKPKSPRAPVPPEPEPRLVIPDAVVIEGEIWRVYRERDAPRRLRGKRALLAEGDAGRCSPRQRAIILADGLADDLLEETLVHELLHALLAQAGDEHLGPALEEHVVELLDGPLMRLLRRLKYEVPK